MQKLKPPLCHISDVNMRNVKEKYARVRKYLFYLHCSDLRLRFECAHEKCARDQKRELSSSRNTSAHLDLLQCEL